MKNFFLLLVIPFNFAFSQQQKDYKAESELIFSQIRNHEFAKVTEKFDSSVNARIDSAKLRQVWENLLRLTGPYESTISITSDHQPNYDVVIQHSQFEKRKIDFKLVFGLNQKIKGISFLPGEPREQYKFPSYFAADSINEKQITIQDGPFRLPGILTTPKKPGRFPLVILIHGSGPNDKDETVGPMKIFKDLAGGLAQKGISVYRYEKRSRLFAARMAKDLNTTVKEETIDDVIAAVNLLKQDSLVDSTAIYLCGHSLGGMLLPRIASQIPGIKGLIYLAANARPLEEILYEQTEYVLSLDTSGKDHKMFLDSIRTEKAKIKALKKSDPDSLKIFHLGKAYWIDLNNYNQVKSAAELKLPMLFLHGARDYQVTEVDFNLWKNGIRSPGAVFKLYPDLNHFFITGTGKSKPSEYSKSGNVDISVINDISNWISSGKK